MPWHRLDYVLMLQLVIWISFLTHMPLSEFWCPWKHFCMLLYPLVYAQTKKLQVIPACVRGLQVFNTRNWTVFWSIWSEVCPVSILPSTLIAPTSCFSGIQNRVFYSINYLQQISSHILDCHKNWFFLLLITVGLCKIYVDPTNWKLHVSLRIRCS